MTPGGIKDPLIGRVIAGKYTIVALLGAGAMGRVYRAKHAALDKQVAIKVLHLSQAKDPKVAARFKVEARAASRLDHPNSVQILDFGDDPSERILYLVMELLKGQSLADVLGRTGQLSSLRACQIMVQVLSALAEAHRNGVVHRDLKPANVMLVKRRAESGEMVEQVKVCDFGIAKVLSSEGGEGETALTLTRVGEVFGTPAFMSPEQARGDKVDPRTDIYSCGVMFYKMITGRMPLKADSPAALLAKLISEEPQPVSQLVSTIDRRLEAVIHRALAKDKTQRFQSAGEMRAALQEILTQGAATDSLAPAAALPDGELRQASSGSGLGSGPFGPGLRPIPRSRATLDPATQSAAATLGATAINPRRESNTSPARSDFVMTGAAPFQTLGASGTGSAIYRSAASPSFNRRSLLIGVSILLAIAVVALGVFLKLRKDPLAQLSELVSRGAYGVAEAYYLESFERLAQQPDSYPLAREALRLQRASDRFEQHSGIHWDSSYRLAPSIWKGQSVTQDLKFTYPFRMVIQNVTEATFEGYLDWHDHGIRSAIRGLHDGNQIVFWDYKILEGSGPYLKYYVPNQKFDALITGSRLIAAEGPHHEKFEATLASDR